MLSQNLTHFNLFYVTHMGALSNASPFHIDPHIGFMSAFNMNVLHVWIGIEEFQLVSY